MTEQIPQLETPILFLIYNRPDYTKRVFDTIRKTKPSSLYIVADGPKNTLDAIACKKSRNITEAIDWPCVVKRQYADENMGVKHRVSSGITWFFENVEQGIILEDDCLPDLSFFYFAEKLLKKYKTDEQVMMISGDNFVPAHSIDQSYLFSRYFPIWGWATWRRAWEKYDIKMTEWPKLKKINWLNKFYIHKGVLRFLTESFDSVFQEKTKTWDTQWAYTCLLNNGLSIIPKVNLVSNIGLTGDHSSPGENNNMPLHTLETAFLVHPTKKEPDENYDKAFFTKSFPNIPIFQPHAILSQNITLMKKITSKINRALESTLGVRISSAKEPKGLLGIAKRVVKKNTKKPNPKDYTTIVGKGSVVPGQVEAYFLALNKHIQEGDRILDVGFGLGYGMTILSIKAKEIYGVDVDPIVYEYCNNMLVGKNPKIKKLAVYDGYNLDYPDNYFDIITCVDVLEHVEDYHRFLDELLRVSKRGVYINTPNRRPEYTNPDGTPKNYWHLREWQQPELDEILKQHGEVDWNLINGPYDGPFTISKTVQPDTLTLSPFIIKKQ